MVSACGSRAAEICDSVIRGPFCESMGISFFGNGLEYSWPADLASDVDALLHAVQLRSSRSVFFVGGVAAKYGYPAEYDARMRTHIPFRKWGHIV